jgi:hypothetical protein
MTFTDEDLKQWKISLSGQGTSFLFQRNDLEGLIARLEAAEKLNDAYMRRTCRHISRHPGDTEIHKAMDVWRKASGK